MANTNSNSTETNNTKSEAIHPRSNVLPESATRDAVDVHWHFNWSETDLSPPTFYSLQELALLGRRVTATTHVAPAEPDDRQLVAAARSRRVRRALLALTPEHVSALARWSAPPSRYPDAVFALFGRLSAVTALTPSFDEIGGSEAFVAACARANGRRDKEDGSVNFLRHAARVKLDVVRAEAEDILRAAFEAYAVARAPIDAEAAAEAKRRRHLRLPHLVAIEEKVAMRGRGDGSAMARLMAKRAGR